MRRLFALIVLLAAAAACTPADQQYCNNLGVGGTAEYANCMDYYHTQEAAFNADREVCDAEADETYPRSLYDRGRHQPVFYGGGGWGGRGRYGHPYGGFGGMSSVYVEPDPYHNAEVTALRNRIVEPCMAARGWNSPNSWQAGRRNVAKKSRKIILREEEGSALPWLK